MAVVSLVFYGGHLYAIMWGTAGIREMVLVGLSCLSAALVQPVGILLFDARMPRSYYVLWFVLMTAASMWGRSSFQVMQRIVNRLNRGDGPGRASPCHDHWRRKGRDPYCPGDEGQ